MKDEYYVCKKCKRIFSELDMDLVNRDWICRYCDNSTFSRSR